MAEEESEGLGIVARLVLGLMLVGAAGGGLDGVTTDRAAVAASCGTALTGGSTDPAVGGSVGGLNREQRAVVELIIAVGKERDLPPRAWQVAIQAGMTESSLRNLNYGDRDSLGIFQMRPSQGWGSPAQVTDPVYQVNKFYDVLLTVPGWESMDPGAAAQAVERSAFPHRYARWEPMAADLIRVYGDGVAERSDCTSLAWTGGGVGRGQLA